MIYIADAYGFVQGIKTRVNSMGRTVYDVTHCVDARSAMPFKTRRAAEQAYLPTQMGGRWHCTVSTAWENVSVSEVHGALNSLVDIVLDEYPQDDDRYQVAVAARDVLRRMG